MTTTLAELISNAIGNFLDDERPFTAYEVTKEVRKHTKDNVKHVDVKETVHAAFHQGLFLHYGRTLANLKGVEIQPWVYYSPGADLSPYGLGKPLMQVIDLDDVDDDPHPSQPHIPVPVLPLLAPPVMTVTDADSAGEDGGWDRSVDDSRESLSVPATLLKDVGSKPGELVYVYANPLNGSVVACKQSTSDPSLTFLQTYTVNLHTNVRITRATLNRAGLPGKDFKIDREGDTIVITAR
jgi:hypothetical protein